MFRQQDSSSLWNGLNIRDWLYVTDHCNAISALLKKGKPGETYNIGNNEIKNIDVILTILKLWTKSNHLKLIKAIQS